MLFRSGGSSAPSAPASPLPGLTVTDKDGQRISYTCLLYTSLGKQQAKTRTCVTAWKALMEQVQADLPYKAFPAADGVVERSYCTQSRCV